MYVLDKTFLELKSTYIGHLIVFSSLFIKQCLMDAWIERIIDIPEFYVTGCEW